MVKIKEKAEKIIREYIIRHLSELDYIYSILIDTISWNEVCGSWRGFFISTQKPDNLYEVVYDSNTEKFELKVYVAVDMGTIKTLER